MTKQAIKHALIGIALVAVATAIGALAVIQSGLYNVAASEQHTRVVYWVLQEALSASIDFHSRNIEAPDLDAAAVERGREPYARHCSRCHGAPGVAPADFALGMKPLPSNLVEVARESSAAEIFWTIKNGIKMSGMPAWGYQLDERAMWDVTAFVMAMPLIDPSEYRRLTQRQDAPELDGGDGPSLAAVRLPEGLGDADEGARAITHYGCTTCHVIPGIIGRDVRVGPSLEGIGRRKYIAGVLVNRPLNMMRWLLDPPEIDPMTAMPDLGITEAHAADIAAYLYTLDGRERDPLEEPQ